MKTILIVLGIIILLGLVAAASFWGGMTYQTSRVERARANFEAARGPTNQGQFPGGVPSFPQGGGPGGQGQFFFRGGGTAGQVKSINGNTMQLSTAQDVTTVNLSESTLIEKSVEGTLADLQPGTRVLVAGDRDADGNIKASRVTILNGDLPGLGGQPTPGTEP